MHTYALFRHLHVYDQLFDSFYNLVNIFAFHSFLKYFSKKLEDILLFNLVLWLSRYRINNVVER